VSYLDYKHWATGEQMDLEFEVVEAGRLAEGLGDYVVVAKSIGCVVATLATARGMIAPKKCVFLGFPLGVIHDLPEVDTALLKLPPTTFVHNEFDTVGSAEEVKAYIAAHAPANYNLQTIPGNQTHDYTDFDTIVQLAKT
jgi:hypothetical protein